MSDATATPHTNPFPGLRPFHEDEVHLFFGRESQVDAMVDKLAATRFLAVVGTSGSGKSSLVNCGLRPALHGGLMARAGTAWRMAQFRPGSDPLREMARALAKDGVLFRKYQAGGLPLADIVDTTLRMSKLGLIDIVEQARLDEGVNLLVVVDQFEELFRYRRLGSGGDEKDSDISEQATAFVNLLLEAGNQTKHPIYVVLTMRSDFLGDCTHFPGLAEAINAGQYLVPRMTRDERRVAIGGPVGVGGAEIAPVLLTRLVNDVGDNPDQLSILQHALNRTWARWENECGRKGSLDLAHYEAIGSMAHALDQHAEKAYAELGTPRQQQICEKLFKALTDTATDPRGIRRPTPLGTLCALADATPAEVTAVIDVFRKPSRSFLMPPAGEALTVETIIDISHESLMRVWERLNTWADEEARSAQGYRRLAEAAVLHGEGKASLWRDPDLQLALNWRDQSQPNETWAHRYHPGFAAAMDFLTQSSEARDAERAEQEAQRRREREAEQEKAEAQARYARSMRGRAYVSGALAVVGLVASVVAGIFWKSADSAAAKAFWQVGIAARDYNHDGVRAAHNFLQAAKRSKKSQRTSFELAAQFATAGLVRSLPKPKGASFVTVSRDGSRVLSVEKKDKGMTLLWDVTKTEPLRTWKHDGRVLKALLSPDASRVLSWGADGTMTLWDVTHAKPRQTWQHGKPVLGALFSPDASRVFSWDAEGTMTLWDVTHEGAPVEVKTWPVPGGLIGAVFTPDASQVLSWDAEGTMTLWDVTHAKPRQTWQHGSKVKGVLFAPDGSRVLSWDAEAKGRVRVWDKSHAEPRQTWQHDKPVLGALFSPDASQVLSWSANGTVRVWDVTKADPPQTLKHGSKVKGALFTPDASRVLSWSADGTVRVWDVTHEDAPVEVNTWPVPGRLEGLLFTPDVSRVLSWSADGTARVWDVTHAEPRQTWQHGKPVLGALFTPDASQVLSWDADGTMTLWDVTHEGAPVEVKTWPVPGGLIGAVFTPDASQVLSWSADGTMRVWDVSHAKPRQTWQHGSKVKGALFTPDASQVLSWDAEGTVRVWDVTHAKPRQTWQHGSKVKGALFTPDASQVLSWDAEGTMTLWDVTHEGAPVEVKTWPVPGGLIGAVFTPDASQVLSWDADGTMTLWDVTHEGDLFDSWTVANVKGALLSPDASRILSWSSSAFGGSSVSLWDVTKADPLQTWKHDGRVLGALLSPDASHVLSSGTEGTMKLWNTDLRDKDLEPYIRILKLEVCSATELQLGNTGRLIGLDYTGWEDSGSRPRWEDSWSRLKTKLKVTDLNSDFCR